MMTCKTMAIFALAVFLILPAGCAYMHVQRPMTSNFEDTQLGSKEGRASYYSILWLVAWGDGGSKAAATKGNIEIIRYADTEVMSVLFGAYMRVTTVIYGD